MQKQPPERGLSRFQHRLLELLWTENDADAIRAALLADPALAPFHDYIRQMETAMLEVGQELVHKWGAGEGDPE